MFTSMSSMPLIYYSIRLTFHSLSLIFHFMHLPSLFKLSHYQRRFLCFVFLFSVIRFIFCIFHFSLEGFCLGLECYCFRREFLCNFCFVNQVNWSIFTLIFSVHFKVICCFSIVWLIFYFTPIKMISASSLVIFHIEALNLPLLKK